MNSSYPQQGLHLFGNWRLSKTVRDACMGGESDALRTAVRRALGRMFQDNRVREGFGTKL